MIPCPSQIDEQLKKLLPIVCQTFSELGYRRGQRRENSNCHVRQRWGLQSPRRAQADGHAQGDRVESSLFRAFETIPKVEKPAGKPQMHNLCIYKSHNEAAGLKKVEMFNQGEIDIFRKVCLNPVFFGEAIAGTRIPNLTYLLAFNDDKARIDAWGKFGGDPDWKKLRAIFEYKDCLTHHQQTADTDSVLTALSTLPADVLQTSPAAINHQVLTGDVFGSI